MSRPVAGLGDAALTGHLCSVVVPILVGTARVLTLGRPTSVVGTPLMPHLIKRKGKCKPHIGVTYGGGNVLASGRPVNKVGDPTDRLGPIITGAPTVLSL